MDKAAYLDFTVEIVRRIDAEPGFRVVPHRWVVEQTFHDVSRQNAERLGDQVGVTTRK